MKTEGCVMENIIKSTYFLKMKHHLFQTSVDFTGTSGVFLQPLGVQIHEGTSVEKCEDFALWLLEDCEIPLKLPLTFLNMFGYFTVFSQFTNNCVRICH